MRQHRAPAASALASAHPRAQGYCPSLSSCQRRGSAKAAPWAGTALLNLSSRAGLLASHPVFLLPPQILLRERQVRPSLLQRVSKQTWTDVPRATSCLSVWVFSGIPSTGGQKFPPSPSPWEAVGEGTLPKPPITRTTTNGSAEQIWNTTNLNSTDQECPGAGNEPQFP